MRRSRTSGFTLIELSIVLVIIGLVIGSILAGQDLVRAAGERAQISQIEKYNQAVNTFYGKYGALPGDLNAGIATQFGFAPRGQYGGEGDGNGYLEGVNTNAPGDNAGYVDGAGETVMFWSDLSYANGMNVNLIDGSFSSASSTNVQAYSGSQVGNYMPAAKIGNGNYVYAYSPHSSTGGGTHGNPANYFGVSAVTGVGDLNACYKCIDSNPGLTVKQAYDIDTKIDDGVPTTGNVLAIYASGSGSGNGSYNWTPPAPSALSPTSATCYDTTSGQYSITQSSGSNVNCALSFKMQAGD